MRKLTTEEFIEKAKEIHNNKYDYSKTIYNKSHDKITIICPIHGEFEQLAYAHLQGKGCKKCGNDSTKNKLKLSNKQFIDKAKQIHENKYDYSKVEYVNSNTPVTIVCPTHGEFKQLPSCHLSGKGCTKCLKDRQRQLFSDSKEEFVQKAKQIHGDKYDYSKVEYINNSTKVCIICPKHGEFWQTPGHHKSGEGCPKCGNFKKFSNKFRNSIISKGEKFIIEWLNNNNISYQYDFPMEIFGKLIRVDFIINKNLFIEYNGIQHYEKNNYFHKTDLDFINQQYRDQQLRKYCQENNIKLIEIRYDQDITVELEKIKDIIKND